jgi:hypothetical protein
VGSGISAQDACETVAKVAEEFWSWRVQVGFLLIGRSLSYGRGRLGTGVRGRELISGRELLVVCLDFEGRWRLFHVRCVEVGICVVLERSVLEDPEKTRAAQRSG